MNKLVIVAVIFLLFAIAMFCAYAMYKQRRKEKYEEYVEEELAKNPLNFANYKGFMDAIGRRMPSSQIEVLFNRSKNPWNMKIETFQAIRVIGAVVGVVLLIICSAFWKFPYGQLPGLLVGGLAWFYPTYYYKAIGNEREEEFNKIYEFIWVLKNNLSLYDPEQALLNSKAYIEEHAPQNKYMIEFFDDYYNHWSTERIDPYITKYYPFSIPKEVAHIVFNSYSTGISANPQLDQLRVFSVNAQDKAVIEILSKVPSQATMYSLPAMMIGVIIAMLVPMLMQFLQYM